MSTIEERSRHALNKLNFIEREALIARLSELEARTTLEPGRVANLRRALRNEALPLIRELDMMLRERVDYIAGFEAEAAETIRVLNHETAALRRIIETENAAQAGRFTLARDALERIATLTPNSRVVNAYAREALANLDAALEAPDA